MTPRPRETSDADIIAATMRIMTRLSPARLTLAEVAKEAGVVPATLIQRFGTKRDLLLAAARTGSVGLEEQFRAARARFRSPLKTLVELMVECTSFAPTPQAMANGLAYLQNDLTDPDFHAAALAQAVDVRTEIRRLLDEAVSAGELIPCDTARVARLIAAAHGGSMLSWAIHREGSLASWVRSDLRTLLAPLRNKGRTRRGQR